MTAPKYLRSRKAHHTGTAPRMQAAALRETREFRADFRRVAERVAVREMLETP